MNNNVLITIKQVAEMLSISVRHVSNLRAKGEFPQPVQGLGRVARWRLADIEAFIASRSSMPAAFSTSEVK